MANSSSVAAAIALTFWTSQPSASANTGIAASKMLSKRKAGKVKYFARLMTNCVTD